MQMRKKSKQKTIYTEDYKALFFILPSIVGMGIFMLIPCLDVLQRAFTDSLTGKFAGIENFKSVLNNQAFRLAIKNTLKFMVICIPLLMSLSLFVAVVLHETTKIAIYVKKAFLFPSAVSVVAAVFLWRMFFHKYGFVNSLLDLIGAQGKDWMNTKAAFWILIMSYIWKNIGYTIILWTVGLANISKDIYEAAKIDGAGKWKQFFYITIPNLSQTFFLIFVLSILNSFKVFREAYLVGGNYPHESIYMIQHLYNNWFLNLAINKMAAGGIIISVILLIVIYILQKVRKDE